jgi:CubicO group peptidase (beta-lactamase class C family)
MMNQDPEAIGFSSARLDRVGQLLSSTHEAGDLMGAAVQVTCHGVALDPICVGRRRLADEGARVEADTIFLVASITKPLAAGAVAKLIEQGDLSLDDRVADVIPGFEAADKENVRIRHLMTHTSGLPDQIPENRAYREAHRPLSDFVARTCELPLAFEAGTKVSYQSSGINVLGAIVERITGTALPEYLDEIFFTPLGLRDTSLGIQSRSERESDVVIAGEGLTYGGAGTDYDWNSDYWRGLGAPWGGLLTTVGEMTRLMLMFRANGELDGVRCLSEATVRTMVTDHASALPDLDPTDHARQRWGLGWRLGGRNTSTYGDLTSDDTYGHGGATGTVAWHDPAKDVTCVIFTNDPDAASWLRPRISNIVMGAVL